MSVKNNWHIETLFEGKFTTEQLEIFEWKGNLANFF